MATKSLLATITGEFYQPVRLHYRVVDAKALMQALAKLSCVKPDPPRQRWVWLYEDEARGLSFQQCYAQIPANLRPVVLCSISQRGTDTFLLDLRSCERALAAIPFFDKHIPRKIAKVTAAEVANKVYSIDNPPLRPEDFFDHSPSVVSDPDAELRRLAELVSQGHGLGAKRDIAMNAIRSAAQQPLPETERIPVHYYEDGIAGFQWALTLRQIVAREHWAGNTTHTLMDAVHAATKSR